MVFGDVHFNYNSMVSKVANIAIHLCEQKWKSNKKAKKSQVLESKKMFSKAVNT